MSNDALKKLAEDASKIEEMDGTLVLEILQAMADGKKPAEPIGSEIDINDPDITSKTTPYEEAILFLREKYRNKYNENNITLSAPPTGEMYAKMAMLKKNHDLLDEMIFSSIYSRLSDQIEKLEQPVTVSLCDYNTVTVKYEEPTIPTVQMISTGGSPLPEGAAEAIVKMMFSGGRSFQD